MTIRQDRGRGGPGERDIALGEPENRLDYIRRDLHLHNGNSEIIQKAPPREIGRSVQDEEGAVCWSAEDGRWPEA